MLMIENAWLVGTHWAQCASALLEDKGHTIKRDADREKNIT